MEMTAHDYQMMAFGKATELLFRTDRRSFNISSAYLWLMPAIKLEQIAFSEATRGYWTAYICWAYLSPETGRRMLDDPPYLAMSDWNEGHDLWIMDAVGVGNAFGPLASRIKARLGREHTTARRLIRDSRGMVTGVRKMQLHRGAP